MFVRSEQEQDEQARILEDETQSDGYTGVVINSVPWKKAQATQVHTVRLTDVQSVEIKQLAQQRKQSVSEILRDAVSYYLTAQPASS
ncbi:hypothetical protein GCM10007377_14190 [Galliscardovia ingluviei]|uniref:Ribbon-helix-helix protein CopG domain-containing protein n=1 Tax=Galliscardovia ingluviei TaxID=1769422 RepID=A0A8J3ARX5_9BIFI|nr:hypothetical protein GCM10007377_14190 [Galliscardovia ingluviei]